jgi:inorganic pyrophosphatase
MNLIKLPIGTNFPNIVNAVVEIPKDSNAKYEYNQDLNMFVLDRCLISSMRYPASYGFIPQTLSDDGDPLDILVYNTVPILTGTLVECRIVGALQTYDCGVPDYKILGIPMYNPNQYNDITDIDEVFLEVTADFFTHYKNYNKKTKPVVVDKWINRENALSIVKEKHKTYKVHVDFTHKSQGQDSRIQIS